MLIFSALELKSISQLLLLTLTHFLFRAKRKTMKVFVQYVITLAFLLFSYANADISKGRRLKPEEFGEIHNRICLQVSDRIAEKMPTTRGEAFRYLTEEMLTLCDEDDSECKIRMHEASIRSQFQDFQSRDYHTVIDDVFPFTLNDLELKNTIKDIYFAIDLLDTMNVEQVKSTIHQISQEYSEKDHHDAKKEVVAITASVAASSTELWIKIFSDPNHGFTKLYNHHRKLKEDPRKLQFVANVTEDVINLVGTGATVGITVAGNSVLRLINVIKSDVLGTVVSTVYPAITAVVTGDPTELYITVLGSVIGDSVAAAVALVPIV